MISGEASKTQGGVARGVDQEAKGAFDVIVILLFEADRTAVSGWVIQGGTKGFSFVESKKS